MRNERSGNQKKADEKENRNKNILTSSSGSTMEASILDISSFKIRRRYLSGGRK
jgi:hypothetical protein